MNLNLPDDTFFHYTIWNEFTEKDNEFAIIKKHFIAIQEAMEVRGDQIAEMYEEVYLLINGEYTRKALKKFIHSSYKFMYANDDGLHYEWYQPWQYGGHIIKILPLDLIFLSDEALRLHITQQIEKFKAKHTKVIVEDTEVTSEDE